MDISHLHIDLKAKAGDSLEWSTIGRWISYSRSSTRAEELSKQGGSLFALSGSIGEQRLSTKPTQPRTTFGKSRRGAPGDGAAGRSPGPGGYDVTRFDSVGDGKVPVTAKASPSYSIGQRFPNTDKAASPGPIYSAHAARAVGGHLDMSHKAVFSKAPRTLAAKSSILPGPGMYGQPASMGKQTSSIRTSSPNPSFTRTKLSAELPKGNPVHISNQHVQDQVGKDSPGPQAYTEYAATGKGKPFLGSKGSAGARFSKAKRMADAGNGHGNPQSPGPGMYRVREAMGRQVLSTIPTSTSAFRTTAQREKWGKTYIGGAHMQDSAGTDSPGPTYEVKKTMKGGALLGSSGRSVRIGTAAREKHIKDPGPAPDSYEITRAFDRPATEPLAAGGISGFSFSTAARPCMQEHSEYSPRADLKMSKDIDQVVLQGVDAPGPGQYLNSKTSRLLSSVGNVNPTLSSTGSVKFGTSERRSVELENSAGDVGPGEYNALYSSFGKQTYSTRKTGSGWSMSKAAPEKGSRVFISKMHSRADAAGSQGGAGPGAYALGDKFALSSKKKSSPSFTFGSAAGRSSFLYL